MKHLKSIITPDFTYPEILEVLIPKESFLLFDIETTGLSHKHSQVVLIGYIVYDSPNYVLHQLFCENTFEETSLLNSFSEIVSEKDYLISYNGQAFDIPFLNSRYKTHNIDCELNKVTNLDIMRLVKKNKEFFDFPDFKLKTVEKFLGIVRHDTISGKESVELYKQYVKTHDGELERKILLHNYEDILYLLQCLKIVDYINPETLYEEGPKTVCLHPYKAFLEDYKIKGDTLYLYFQTTLLKPYDYEDHLSIPTFSYNSSTHTIKMKVPLFTLSYNQQTLSFIDIDQIENFEVTFNLLSPEKRMSYLIHDGIAYSHTNIYRLSQQCFELFRPLFE